MAVRLAEMPREQFVIAAVGLPCDIEGIAEDWNCSDQDVEREVHNHTCERYVGHSAKPRCYDDDAGGETGEDVSDEGHEADEAIDAEANGCAGDAEAIIENVREQVEIFVGEYGAAYASSRRQWVLIWVVRGLLAGR